MLKVLCLAKLSFVCAKINNVIAICCLVFTCLNTSCIDVVVASFEFNLFFCTVNAVVYLVG